MATTLRTLTAAFGIGLGLAAAPVAAATFTLSPDNARVVVMQGPIVAGDAERLAAFVGRRR